MTMNFSLRSTARRAMSAAALLAAAGAAQAVSLALVDPGGAISRFDWSLDGTTIRVESTWSGRSPAFVQVSGLTARVAYTVEHTLINDSAAPWRRVANELLDPAGQDEDRVLDTEAPRWVPAGWSTSNGNDGLSFAKGLNLPRRSAVFAVATWEPVVGPFIDKRDYVDFLDGRIAAGGGIDDFQTFGLRDNCAVCGNQPFLWAIRPGAASVAVVPEPATTVLWLAGLAGLAAAGRRQRQRGR